MADYLDSLVKRGVISASAAQRLTAQRADSGGFGDPNLQEQAGYYDIPRGGQEYPGAMMPVSPPSFADRLQSFGARGAPVTEDRRAQKPPPRWAAEPFPLPPEIWLNEIQKLLGTNWTPPSARIGRQPARTYPLGQLSKDIGREDIYRQEK